MVTEPLSRAEQGVVVMHGDQRMVLAGPWTYDLKVGDSVHFRIVDGCAQTVPPSVDTEWTVVGGTPPS